MCVSNCELFLKQKNFETICCEKHDGFNRVGFNERNGFQCNYFSKRRPE